jgi:carboxypeptidase C (cathepsin A)
LIIGNGWFDPLTQFQAYYNFTVNPGNTYNFHPFNQSEQNTFYDNLYGSENCVNELKLCAKSDADADCAAADEDCSDNVANFLGSTTGRYSDDIRHCDDPIPDDFETYLNTPEVQLAIGAYVNYTSNSQAVEVAFSNTGDDSREDGTIEEIRTLISSGTYVVLYNGDADNTCSWTGVQTVADLIHAPGFASAGFANTTVDGDEEVKGVVKQANNFAFLRIYNAGHEAAYYEPELALQIVERTINGTDIETGTIRVIDDACKGNYTTTGPLESLYVEGNSTITHLQGCPIDDGGGDGDDS